MEKNNCQCQINVSTAITEFIAEYGRPFDGVGISVGICNECISNRFRNIKFVPLIHLKEERHYEKDYTIKVEILGEREIGLAFFTTRVQKDLLEVLEKSEVKV